MQNCSLASDPTKEIDIVLVSFEDATLLQRLMDTPGNYFFIVFFAFIRNEHDSSWKSWQDIKTIKKSCHELTANSSWKEKKRVSIPGHGTVPILFLWRQILLLKARCHMPKKEMEKPSSWLSHPLANSAWLVMKLCGETFFPIWRPSHYTDQQKKGIGALNLI